MTALLSPDEYMAVLEGRLAEWRAKAEQEQAARIAALHAQGHTGVYPRRITEPLLAWFVRAGDEALIDVAAWEAQETARPKPAPRVVKPRGPVNVDALKAQRARLVAEQEAIGSWMSDDPAAVRLGAKTARRVQERADRDLARYTKLSRRIARLDWRITLGESWNERLAARAVSS